MAAVVDIKGIDKVMLLHALWDSVEPSPIYSAFAVVAPKFNHSLAERAIAEGPINYFCGHRIMCDLSGDTVDPFIFDREAERHGAFAKIANKLGRSNINSGSFDEKLQKAHQYHQAYDVVDDDGYPYDRPRRPFGDGER